MSAMMAVMQADRAFLLADAALYDPAGVLTAIVPKVWPIPALNAAFSSRGAFGHFVVFNDVVTEAAVSTFDELSAALPEIWRDFDSRCARDFPGTSGEVMIIGRSETAGRFEALYRCTHRGWPGLEPGSTYRFLDVAAFAPGMDTFDLRADQFEPRTDGLAAMEHARRSEADLSCGERSPLWGYSVGGGVICATLTPSSIAIEILHHWQEDQVGQAIQPSGIPRRRVAEAA